MELRLLPDRPGHFAKIDRARHLRHARHSLKLLVNPLRAYNLQEHRWAFKKIMSVVVKGGAVAECLGGV